MARTDRIAFLPRRSLVAVWATINRAKEFALLVDSGAERMVLSRRAAELLGHDLARPLRAEPLVGVGHTVAVPVVRLNHVQVGASAVTSLLASVYDLPASFRADGLIGLNFLRHGRVTVEFDTQTLVRRPQRRRRPLLEPHHAGYSRELCAAMSPCRPGRGVAALYW